MRTGSRAFGDRRPVLSALGLCILLALPTTIVLRGPSFPGYGGDMTEGPASSPRAAAVAPSAPSTYPVAFTETGLAAGTEWFVNISGAPSRSSTTGTISVSLANATYTYTVGTVDKRDSAVGGTFAVGGRAVSVSVTFLPVTFLVTFTESGLPAGTRWYVNVTGTPYLNTTGTTMMASLTNGSYLYGVGTSDHAFYAHGGTFTVNDAAVTVTVSFGPAAKFLVTFTESGLPSGALWSVNVSGSGTLSSATGAITTTLFNGSYTFSVGLVGGHWVPVPTLGFFAVAGGPITPADVEFVYAFQVTIERPAGTPSGTAWSVELTGPNVLPLTAVPGASVAQGSSKGSVSFYEPNGSYSYLVLVASNWGYRGTGAFAIDGQNVAITPAALPPPGLDPYLLYGAVVGGAILVAAAALVALARRRPRSPVPMPSSEADAAAPTTDATPGTGPGPSPSSSNPPGPPST